MKNDFYIILFLIFSFLLQSGCSLQQEKDLKQNWACTNCNVIIIDISVLKADHLGAYGYERNTSSYIDTFAEKSLLFRNMISASSWTLPSVMSIFTSTYPTEHGLVNNKIKYPNGELKRANIKEINPNIVTLAEILNKSGYVTAGFTGDAHLNSSYGYGNGFSFYYDDTPFSGFEKTIPFALRWLESNKDKKFFLFIQGYDLHGRYILSQNTSRKFINSTYAGKYSGAIEEQIYLRDLNLQRGYLNLSDEDREFWISLYDSKLYDADERIGRFLMQLENLDLLNRSIVIILGDHGEELFEHKGIDHGYSLYDELIHVPLIIHIPNSNKQIRIYEQVRTVDLFPTIIEILDLKISENLEDQIRGESLIPIMNGQKSDLDAYSETDYLYKVFKRSIRKSNGWKIIYSIDTNEFELYNLNKDPSEKNNLVEQEPKIAYGMEQELLKYMYER